MMKYGEPRPEQSGTVDAIVRELKNLDESAFPTLHALAENELFRLRGGIAESVDIVSNRQVKMRVKVDIPSSNYPGINFVGKLLGPGGQTLRATQESTQTKMAVLGSGSLRDENKERELLASGDPKFQHLKHKLHLQIDSLAPPSEAFYRLSHALAEVRKVMLPESNEFPPPPWNPQGPQPVPNARGGGRGGRGGSFRGQFQVPPPSSPYRGRGRPWGNRGGAPNGTAVMPNPPVVADPYGNGTVPTAPYAAMGGMYEQQDYKPNMYEDFGANYGQDDTWGKVGVTTENRGRGRANPYARPGMNPTEPQ